MATTTTAPADTSALYGDVLPHSVLDFARERGAASFAVSELSVLCAGGCAYQTAKVKTARQLARIPWVADIAERWPDMSRAEKREATVQQIRALFRMFINDHGDVMLRNARVEMASLYSPDWVTRNGVHFGLFVGAIVSQASAEQADEWLPRAMGLSIFGCFAMTELRGGSYIKGLQTTATYIPQTSGDSDTLGCWELHTPHVGATKWWIGGAGETATHAAVYARVLCKGRDCGVHVFLVQLRDMSTHAPLPGVHIGDVGGKMGRDGIDNGWIQFHHYRVPHSAFLCKYARVDADGTYTPQPAAKPQLAYGALIQGRAHMVQDSASILQLAVTIAVRWAVARRQGAPFNQSGAQKEPCDPAVEPQLLDYSTHQAKLLPLVATAYAFTFTAHRMKEMYENLMNGMDTDDISLLPDVHATSSGLKAFTTWATHYGIDTCRQACGGHGYSSYSRLPQLFADFAVMCTWEGDNTVMALQTSRYLIKSLAKAKGTYKRRGAAMQSPEPLRGSVRYLVDRIPPRCGAGVANALLDLNTLLTALRWRARTCVIHCNAALEAHRARGLTEGEAWNATAVKLVTASRAHVYLNIAAFFAVAVARRGVLEEDVGILTTAGAEDTGGVVDPLTGKRVDETPFVRVTGFEAAQKAKVVAPAAATSAATDVKSRRARGRSAAARIRTPSPDEPVTSALYPILKRLCAFFILYHIQGDMAEYLRYGYFSAEQAAWIDAHVAALMLELRKDALPLVDAFGIPDFLINSPMAVHSGDVYRAYMARVKRVPEATQNAAEAAATGGAVPASRAPYFNAMLKPLLEGEDLSRACDESDVLINAAEMDDADWAAYAASIKLYDTPTA